MTEKNKIDTIENSMNSGVSDSSKSSGNRLRLSEFLPYRMSILSNRISRGIADKYADAFGISLPEWRVMAILGERSEISAGEVADLTAMDKVAVSRAVNSLITKGHIERHTSQSDRRRSVLELSASGRDIYQQIVPMALGYEERLKSALTGQELETLDALLTKLAKGID